MTIQPIGSIVAYPAQTAPQGWLLCDGSAIPGDADHQALRTLVGPKTPDLRGYFLRGLDVTQKVDPGIGDNAGAVKPRTILSLQSDAVGPHAHQSDFPHRDSAGKSGAGSPDVLPFGLMPDHHPTTNPNAAAGVSTENRPKNVAVVYIIKAIDEG